MYLLLGVSLISGLAFNLVFLAMLLTFPLIARDVWVHDYPPAIRERHGPKSRRGRRVTVVASVLLAAVVTGVCVLGMTRYAALSGTTPGFVDGLVFGTVFMLVWTVVDIVVIDWWIFCTIRPRVLVVPGTEDMDEYGDKRFHVDVMLPWPILMIPGFGVVVGTVAWALS